MNGEGRRASYVSAPPTSSRQAGALSLPPGLAPRSPSRPRRAPRRRLRRGAARRCPPTPRPAAAAAGAAALVVLEETCAPDAAETIAFMREQEVDLKLISGDARGDRHRGRPAVGCPRRRWGRGPRPADDPEELAEVALANTIFCRIKPDQKKALVAALVASGRYVAMIGDGVNDVPALKRARMAVAMGSGAQVTKGIADVVLLKDEFSRLPEAVGEGRRIARNIHRLGRLYLTKSVYAGTLICSSRCPASPSPSSPAT